MSDVVSGVSDNQPATQNTEVNNSAVNTENTTVAPVTQETQSAPINEVEIEGLGKVKYDEIKEWKNGHMRQSDYTKKTQEVSAQRKEAERAMQVYKLLESNPQLVQALQNGDFTQAAQNPVLQNALGGNKYVEDLAQKVATIELDGMINGLKSRYNDFNEVEVLNEADRLGIADLEFVYHALQGKKVPQMREQLEKDIRTKLTEQIRKNGLDTSTMISDNDQPTHTANFGLSEAELSVAGKMGISPEAYAKGKARHI